MGRLRARLAKNPVDREALDHISRADASLRRAADVYLRALTPLKGPGKGQDRRKMQERIDLLLSAMSMISSIKPVQSRFDLDEEGTKPRSKPAKDRGRKA